MTLRDEDVGRIGEYVKPWLREMVDERVPRVELGGVGTQLLERMVRVEEELKAQRMLMDERFGFMTQRFESADRRFDELVALTHHRFEESSAHNDKRFDDVDKRFADVSKRFDDVDKRFGDVNERFDDVDKRFGDVSKRFDDVDKRFGDVDRRFDDVDKRFGDVSKRFDDVDKRFGDVNERFDDVDKRFDDVNARFTTLTWMIGVGFVVITSLTSVFALLS
jgi:archaellum component FlaC